MLNKTFLNLLCGVFCLWALSFCGFFYHYARVPLSAFYASLVVIFALLLILQPETKKIEDEEKPTVKRQ